MNKFFAFIDFNLFHLVFYRHNFIKINCLSFPILFYRPSINILFVSSLIISHLLYFQNNKIVLLLLLILIHSFSSYHLKRAPLALRFWLEAPGFALRAWLVKADSNGCRNAIAAVADPVAVDAANVADATRVVVVVAVRTAEPIVSIIVVTITSPHITSFCFRIVC